jgi:hypothetical protein
VIVEHCQTEILLGFEEVVEAAIGYPRGLADLSHHK